MHTQVAVLGGGPGGYAAAFIAADHGLEVTLVEADARLGGTCLLRGCIPSKALLHVAHVMHEVGQLQSEWGISYGQPQIDLDRLRARKEQVIERMSGGLAQLAKRRNVRVIHARGHFANSQTLLLEGDHPSIPTERELTFDRMVLATGSTPAIPANLALDSPRVLDSTGALKLDSIPRNMLVIGGGYIGLEMGTVYAQLGTQLSVVELTGGLLPGADRDLVKPLQKRYEQLTEGRLFLNTKVGSLGDLGDRIEVAFEGPGKYGVERFERVLISVGRRPNSRGLGLENTRVQVNQRGFVQVDKSQRTADPHILAIGDVVGEPMLAHKASHEAKVAVETIAGKPAEFRPAAIPAVVFTDPELAWVGLTQEQAERENIPVEIALYPWAASGRAQSLGRTDGLTKLLIEPETERVLGCGLVGPGAGELISEMALALEMGCEAADLADTIHPHPTLSETLMNAAEVFFGSAVEIYKPRRTPAAS
ncbi:MAG: dihydrolipoyl dehydrogenase [Pirellulales bacterium]